MTRTMLFAGVAALGLAASPSSRSQTPSSANAWGGRTEPFGTDLKGAALSVPEGVDDVPGLKEALGK